MIIETTNRLMETISELALLEPSRLGELSLLAERFPGVLDLGRQLIQQEWLTAYQINQVMQGRGRQLLLGPYILLERIGAGGMGEVFKARHRRLQRFAAVKVVSRTRVGHANAVQRFFREAAAAAHLSHPNIVAVYDFGEERDTYYLAMEYIDGVDLGRLLQQVGPLPVSQACDFIRQAALGLHHAHEQGLVHRDIKPQNLLLAPRRPPRAPAARGARDTRELRPLAPHGGQALPVNLCAGATVKILDMGLIRMRPDRVVQTTELALTQYGVVIGTMDYLSPEQARNAHCVDHRADLYSLGCTLYHLLAGEPVFPGGLPLEKLLRHQSDPPPSVRDLRPDVPVELEIVIDKLLAKRPEERPQSATDAAAALGPFVSKTPATVVSRRKPISLSAPTRDSDMEATRAFTLSKQKKPANLPQAPTSSANIPVQGMKRGSWLLGLAAILLLLAGAAALWYKAETGNRKSSQVENATSNRASR